jgi:transcriptional regulator with XRE-family HTH domain
MAENAASFADRLRILVDRAGSVLALARSAGVSDSSVHLWLDGSEPSREKLVKLATAADVSIEWLAAGKGEMLPRPPMPGEYDELWMALVGLTPNPAISLITVRDDTMEPTLRQHDTVAIDFIDFKRQASSGAAPPSGIYLLDGWIIRRVEWQFPDRTAVISCDNPAYGRQNRTVKFRDVHLKAKVYWRAGRI